MKKILRKSLTHLIFSFFKKNFFDIARRGKARLPCGLEYPSGNWIAPAGSDLESHGGNEVA
jgi:hypothetical protein